MVLEFGLLASGLFPDSENLGVGVAGGLDNKGVVESYNGKLITVLGTTDISTSTTYPTYADIADMTYTVLQDGLYLVLFSMTLEVVAVTNGLVQVKILQNTTIIGQSNLGCNVDEFPNTVTAVNIRGEIVIPMLVDLKTGDVVKAQWAEGASTTVGNNSPANEPDTYHRKMVFCRLWSNV